MNGLSRGIDRLSHSREEQSAICGLERKREAHSRAALSGKLQLTPVRPGPRFRIIDVEHQAIIRVDVEFVFWVERFIRQHDQLSGVGIKISGGFGESDASLRHDAAFPTDLIRRPSASVVEAEADRVVVVAIGEILPAMAVHQDWVCLADVSDKSRGGWAAA